MFIRLVVQEALKSLASHWVRTTLTMFGILWGIATVIILVAIVQGFYESSKRSIRALGANTIRIEYQDTYKDGDAVYALRGDPSDAHLIKESIPYVRRAVPYISTWTQMQGSLPYQEYGGIVATTSEITEIRELEVEQGRFFNPVDEKLAAPRVVIGGWINERFFANQAKLGDTIRIAGMPFEIIGILKRGGNFNDHFVWMPVSTMQNYLIGPARNWQGQFTIQVEVNNLSEVSQVKEEVKRVLAARHGIPPGSIDSAFRIRDLVEQRKKMDLIFLGIIWIFRSIGILTLLVGAVGVTNIMLVSVAERTREIGLRKALGSTRRSILLQFLAEALTITAIGGVLGILLGIGLVRLIANIPLGEGFSPPVISPSSIWVAVIVLGMVGLASGIYPAWRAAQVDPIIALRTE